MNEYCSKDPLESPTKIVVSCDGDFVCSPACKETYNKQVDYFCSEVLTDDKKLDKWWKGVE